MKVNQQNEDCFPKNERSETKLNFLHVVSLEPYGYLKPIYRDFTEET